MLLSSKTIHSKWDNSLEPLISVSDGDEIFVETRDASDGQINPGSTVADVEKLQFDRIHPLTGPIEVKGAEPGDALEVEFLEFKHKGWGWTAIIPGFGLLAEDVYTSPVELSSPALKIWKVEDETAKSKFGSLDVKIKIRPFPGVIGTALPQKGKWSTIPPRENGGNMDVKQLSVGSKVYLPVFVKGALLSIGDTHLAQGDGEVCGTAIEAPLEHVKIRLRLHKNLALSAPVFWFPKECYQECVAFPGIDQNLWEATKKAVKSAIGFLTKYMSAQEAYMLISVAADLKVSEVVDRPNWIVTCCVPTQIFSQPLNFP
jgi:acetamidase/formamidase